MQDAFGRTIDYLRVSVTDRCNLRCVYCMPEEGVPALLHDEIIRFEEILDLVRAAVDMGFTKIRITGGEPLVRTGIVNLVDMLAKVRGILDLAMTTNGVLLSRYARDLRNAGLMRVNVSLDALDPCRFRERTRGGDVREVLEGIDAAEHAGLTPLKLNCVVDRDSSDPDALDVARYASDRGFLVRFIRRMDIHGNGFSRVEGGSGGDCPTCNRIRVSSAGIVAGCLFDSSGYSIREMGVDKALRSAIEAKPERGTWRGDVLFSRIGG